MKNMTSMLRDREGQVYKQHIGYKYMKQGAAILTAQQNHLWKSSQLPACPEEQLN
jgi:hypothetical protein